MRYPTQALQQFARDLLLGAHLEQEWRRWSPKSSSKAICWGTTRTDWRCLRRICASSRPGRWRRAGSIGRRGARPSALWDGDRLPGPWLTRLAIDDAIERARCGTGTVVIRRSHHIACLAAYLTRATERGFVSAAFVFRSQCRKRCTARRNAGGVHSGSDRIRISHRRRSGTDRSVGIADHQRNDRAIAQERSASRTSMAVDRGGRRHR